MGVVVYAHRHANLTRGYHVNRRLETLEYLKDLAQETCRQQHTAALYLYRRNVVFRRHGLYLSC